MTTTLASWWISVFNDGNCHSLWRHQMETFPRYCPLVRRIHQWPLMFFWSSVWTTVEQTLEWPVIRDATTSIWRRHNVLSPVRVQMATDLESVTNNVTYVILKHFKGSHTTPPNKWQFLSKRGNTIIWWGEIRIINQICLFVLTVWRLPATQWLCIMYIFNAEYIVNCLYIWSQLRACMTPIHRLQQDNKIYQVEGNLRDVVAWMTKRAHFFDRLVYQTRTCLHADEVLFRMHWYMRSINN